MAQRKNAILGFGNVFKYYYIHSYIFIVGFGLFRRFVEYKKKDKIGLALSLFKKLRPSRSIILFRKWAKYNLPPSPRVYPCLSANHNVRSVLLLLLLTPLLASLTLPHLHSAHSLSCPRVTL